MNFYVRLYEFVNLNLCYPKNFVLCILVQCINLCPVIYKRLRVTQLHWVMDSGSSARKVGIPAIVEVDVTLVTPDVTIAWFRSHPGTVSDILNIEILPI